jgi:elongation factor G
VDQGTTIMDYMEQERERGITITSAAITFPWKDCQINLIDTPGHIDFSIEVERALRVLDGAITILDASAGVQAQTHKVWRQANKFKIPRIVYINKMDKLGANFNKCLRSLEEKLTTKAVPVQIPIGNNKDFIGVIDLISMNKLTWDNEKSLKENGKYFKRTPLTQNDPLYQTALSNRIKLIEKLAQQNEKFADILLERYQLNYEKMNDNILLDTHLRTSTVDCQLVPLFCGSSFKNISVQQLMDGINKYLPCPSDLKQNDYEQFYGNKFSGVSFKIIHDHQRARKLVDPTTSLVELASSVNTSTTKSLSKRIEDEDNILSYVRVYSGELHANRKIFNVDKNVVEHCNKIYIPFANQLKQVNKVTNGNIALISGLSKVIFSLNFYFFLFLFNWFLLLFKRRLLVMF